ncbi:MAG: chloride channel protein [Planctomycetota bacterium]|nr:chloride channel protein [Planctomycetota bacterium]
MSTSEKHQEPCELEDARLWRTTVFSWGAWWRHGLVIVAACLTGLFALFFREMDIWGLQFFRALTGQKEWFGWQVSGTLGVILGMVLITVSMIAIMRLRDVFFPGTEGTGIPQAIASRHVKEGPIRKFMLSGRILIGKTILLCMGLFSGMTIGREGPSVHVGACFMYLITKIARFPEHLVQRGLILGGGGAGIAAAFNAPIAGMIFAFEEIGRSFDKNCASTIVRVVLLASVVVVAILGWDYLFYGSINRHFGFEPMHWLAVPIIGCVGGFLGGLFAQSVVWGTPIVTRNVKRHPYLTAGVLGLSLAGLGLASGGQSYGSGYPQAKAILMYRGTDYYGVLDVPKDATREEIHKAYLTKQRKQPLLTVADVLDEQQLTITNAWHVLGDPQERAFYDEWHLPEGYPWWYPFMKAGGSYFSLISGIPGGLFDPSLSVGAGLGNVCADFCHDIFGGLDPQFCIMLFMVAYFAGVVQSPITVFVIMIEMTDARFVTLPLMVSAILAYECSHLVCRTAIYEALAEIFLGGIEKRAKDKGIVAEPAP